MHGIEGKVIRVVVAVVAIGTGISVFAADPPAANAVAASPATPSTMLQYCGISQNASAALCLAYKDKLCADGASTDQCAKTLDTPISTYCGVGVNADLKVCAAYRERTCTEGVTVDLCRKKLNQGFFGSIFDNVTSNPGLRDALGALIIAALGAVIALARRKIKVLDDRLGDPLLLRPEAAKYETRGVNVLLVGLGGSGKTSIIRALSGCGEANPAAGTSVRNVKIYNLVQEVDVQADNREITHTVNRIYIEDYAGQEAGRRLHDPAIKKREQIIPSTVICIVVDLFHPPTSADQGLAPSDSWSEKRVKEQIKEYPKGMLNGIRRMSDTCKQVCLFINKADLLTPYEASTHESILDRYSTLRSEISFEFQSVPFSTIVGAAATGWGISGHDPSKRNTPTLLELINRAATPIDLSR